MLGLLLITFALSASGVGKMWFHSMVRHIQIQRELKTTQLAIVGLTERLEKSATAPFNGS